MLGGLLLPGGAAAKPPKGFLGMNVNGPLDDPAFDLAGEARQMRSTGVRSWRVEFSWDLIEPKPGEFSWGPSDRKVLAAAGAGIDVLGLAVRAPAWANKSFLDPFVPPKDPAAYGRFTAALVRRYGPDGELWKENANVRKRPVRAWEIWNEPNLEVYFRDQPFEKPYAKLLRSAYKSIKTLDKRSTVVMAGMANFSWRDLDRLLRKEKNLRFDAAAVHPFTGKPSGMIEIARRNRVALDRRGKKKASLWLTEMTWSSAKGKKTPLTKGWETTESGQARRLTQAYRQLAKYRKRLSISHVYWYTWASRDDGSPNSFEYSGLRTTRGESDGGLRNKPAFGAFQRIAK